MVVPFAAGGPTDTIGRVVAEGMRASLGQPGISIGRLAQGERPNRTVLSEYHGMGSTTGAFAIRNGAFKYVHYVKYPPQLFNLQADPDEASDLAADAGYAAVLSECERKLRALLSPEDV